MNDIDFSVRKDACHKNFKNMIPMPLNVRNYQNDFDFSEILYKGKLSPLRFWYFALTCDVQGPSKYYTSQRISIILLV